MAEKIRIKMKHLLVLLFLFGIIVTVPILYQNCSAPLLEGSDVSSVAASAPFAYEAKIDHLAYMSCSGMATGYNTNAYFTFKAGGYNDGSGIRLNNAFVYAARNLVVSDKAAALQQSNVNGDAFLQLVVRSSTNLQSAYKIGNMFQADYYGSLSAPGVANQLAQDNGVNLLKNFTATTPTGKFEDTIHFTSSGSSGGVLYSDQVRTEVSTNNNYLALSYSRVGQNGDYAVSYPENSATSVFGTGYKMAFVFGKGQTDYYSTGPTRVMTNLTEYNLTNNQINTGSTWECNPSWAFEIIKYEDVFPPSARVTCNTVEPTPTTAADIEALDVARKILPLADWYIDLVHHCVVPKAASPSCYGTSTAVVNYNGKLCGPGIGECPHFVSICKRR